MRLALNSVDPLLPPVGEPEHRILQVSNKTLYYKLSSDPVALSSSCLCPQCSGASPRVSGVVFLLLYASDWGVGREVWTCGGQRLTAGSVLLPALGSLGIEGLMGGNSKHLYPLGHLWTLPQGLQTSESLKPLVPSPAHGRC